jgi:acetyl esterase/lipase
MLKITLVAVVSALVLAACSKPVQTTPPPPAATPAAANVALPATPMAEAPKPDGDMQEVLDKLASLGGKPIETLDPAEARKQPTPADAVMALMKDKNIDPNTGPKITTKDMTYPAGKGSEKARVYTPDGEKGPLPVILYIHGGGWVIADIDVYGAAPKAIAGLAKAIVVSIEYRHAPENKFPAAHDDANAAYVWILKNAAGWGGDPARVAVLGESAGGNMVVNVAINARDKQLQAPKAVIAVYPVANTSPDTASKKAFVAAKPLSTPMLDWFFKHTLASPDQAKDPRLNLIAAKLDGLPPTTIIVAQIDPLHDDGVRLGDALKAAGNQVEVKEYEGVTHEFFGMGSVVADAKAAEGFAADKLKDALKK